MPLDMWFGQFNTVNGAVLEEGPFVGVFDGAADEPDAVGVYMLVEPCGGASPELCGRTVEVIARNFGDPAKALTANLLHALTAAHAYIRTHHPGEHAHEFGVGVSVLATRRSEAYLAQAGPALACIRSGGVARVFEPPTEGPTRPLGSGSRATPTFSRVQLRAQDSAVLLFHSGAHLVDARRLPTLVAQPPDHALPEIYLRCRGERNFAALYLSVLGERIVAAVPPRERASARTQRGAGSVAVAATGSREALTPVPVEATETDPSRRNGHSRSLAESVRTAVPKRAPLGSMTSAANPFTRRRVVAGGAVLAVALLLLMALPGLARQGKSEKFNQLVRGADEAVSQAEREPDLAKRRALLAKAQSTVDEARALSATPNVLAPLDQRLSAQLAELNSVRDLADLVQIADLASPGLAAPAASSIALGPMIYILDATAGKVMALPREGDPRPVTAFEEGRPAGQFKTGRARAMTWWPAEGTRAAALLVLDDQRRLYALDARGDIRQVALGETGEWKSDTAITVGTSQLYVLDAAGSQVWRYAQSAGGFPGAPEPLLSNRSTLRDATGISIVGTPLLATSDGRLVRIADGREQPLQPIALDRPLLAPGPPTLYAPDGLLYIADKGNQRIVRLSPDGTFRGQLVHVRLAGLRSVAYDEAEGTLYAIVGQSVIRAGIPK